MKPFIIDETKEISILKSIRMPEELVKNIERVISKKDINFSNFVIQACIYALDNMEESHK